ncbi:hypothetical protein MBLNU230_g3141t1 [Neophaeotheca triangularis]
MSQTEELPPLPLPEGITEKYVDCSSSCGLNFHILTAGEPGNPLILFCHGYPELAFSWRKILPSIAKSGYYCVAMDQRGYGRTTGWPKQPFHEVDLLQYTLTNLVRDLVCLVYNLGYTSVYCIVGHDFGAVSSATAALMRPDMFKATVQMSHPHHAPETPASNNEPRKRKRDIQTELANLSPPRKHYKWYNSTPPAAYDWDNPPQNLTNFLRGYFHLKSGDWQHNKPRPLTEWSGKQLEQMPEYYIMPLASTMPEVVQTKMATEDATKTHPWLSESDLAVYVQEWSRTGFQGALNWYRARTVSQPPEVVRDLLLFAGRRLEVPVVFISGSRDWGNFQQPGALEGYEGDKVVAPGCFRGVKMVEGAGHWVQQEKPGEVVAELLGFLKGL